MLIVDDYTKRMINTVLTTYDILEEGVQRESIGRGMRVVVVGQSPRGRARRPGFGSGLDTLVR